MVCLVYDIILFPTVMFIVNIEVTCVVKPTPSIHPKEETDTALMVFVLGKMGWTVSAIWMLSA